MLLSKVKGRNNKVQNSLIMERKEREEGIRIRFHMRSTQQYPAIVHFVMAAPLQSIGNNICHNHWYSTSTYNGVPFKRSRPCKMQKTYIMDLLIAKSVTFLWSDGDPYQTTVCEKINKHYRKSFMLNCIFPGYSSKKI